MGSRREEGSKETEWRFGLVRSRWGEKVAWLSEVDIDDESQDGDGRVGSKLGWNVPPGKKKQLLYALGS